MHALDIGSGSGYLTAVMALMVRNCQFQLRKITSPKTIFFALFSMKVGPSGRAVGVEHIPQLVQRSIQAIQSGEAAHLMTKGHLSIHGEISN